MSKVVNFYEKMGEGLNAKVHNPHFNKHGIALPFRMLIVGSSGSGKTNVLCNIIYNMPDTFSDITVLTRNADEPLYNLLKKKLKDGISIIEDMAQLPDLDTFDKTKNHLVVFDDMVLNKDQRPMSEYFIRARKLNVSVAYISQSYFGVPKIIRSNVSYIIFKKLSAARDISLIMTEYTLGVDAKMLTDIYRDATKDRLDFLLIDIDNPDLNKKFRKNFQDAYAIESDSDDE